MLFFAALLTVGCARGLRSAPLSRRRVGVRGGVSAAPASASSSPISRGPRLAKFVESNFFVLGMVAAVTGAYGAPQLCRDGSLLRPELILGSFGVPAVFLLSAVPKSYLFWN